MKKARMDNAGTSLIEFVIALTLLAVVSVPLLQIFATSAVMVKKSRENLDIISISKQIKSDVYFAFKSDPPVTDSLFMFNISSGSPTFGTPSVPANNFEIVKDINTNSDIFGIYIEEFNKIHPNYYYKLIRNDEIFSSTVNLNVQLVPTKKDKKFRVDLYKRQPNDSFKINRSFYLMIPNN